MSGHLPGPGKFQWLRYVVHTDVERMMALGWRVVDNMQTCHHGKYAVLMEWKGEGDPPQ